MALLRQSFVLDLADALADDTEFLLGLVDANGVRLGLLEPCIRLQGTHWRYKLFGMHFRWLETGENLRNL